MAWTENMCKWATGLHTIKRAYLNLQPIYLLAHIQWLRVLDCVCICVCELWVGMQWQKDALCPIHTGHGSRGPLTRDCQASQPSLLCAPIPLYIHQVKSSRSGPATVKPLLCTVPAWERAALSSILPSHMLGVFRKMSCIISWSLVCMSQWKHDHILNSGLPATFPFTQQYILCNLTMTGFHLIPVSTSK